MTTSLDMIRGRSNIVTLTNNSGGGLVAGDVCVQDTTADEKVTTTTSANSVLKVFVAAETIASGAAGRFYESGYCPLVNVSASVTRGRFLFTHTVAKQAAENATWGSGAFGKILKSGTTPSAIIYSATAQTSGGGGAATTDHFIVGQGGEGDTDLSAKIIIPRLSSHPDIRVAGANDDEFDTTDTSDPMTGWTTMGTPTAHDINNTFKSHYYVKKAATAGVNLTGIYKAMTVPFIVTCRISAITIESNYNIGGLFVAEASPGKIDMMEMIWNSTRNFQAEQFSSPTGSSSAFISVLSYIGIFTPMYFRINVHSSTNVDYLWSHDGYLFDPLALARNPGFTVGAAGLAISTTGTGNGVEMAVDWIRFS